MHHDIAYLTEDALQMLGYVPEIQEGADHLSVANFARLAAFIYKATGIKMPATKRTMLDSRLRRRVRATGTGSIQGYCDWLFTSDHLDGESVHLINAVTTNKTDFFREPRHFEYISDTILPDLTRNGVSRLRVWSAACSTGAEPYTIAMLLDAYARDSNGPDFEILATDLDTEVLEAARRGIFQAAMVDVVPAMLRSRYIMAASAPGRDEVRMAPRLRAAINFARMNLMDKHYPVGAPMDLILCRNVLIYFDKPTQERVVRRLTDCLKPGGYLFLGHSESITGFDLPLKAVSNTVFQRS